MTGQVVHQRKQEKRALLGLEQTSETCHKNDPLLNLVGPNGRAMYVSGTVENNRAISQQLMKHTSWM